VLLSIVAAIVFAFLFNQPSKIARIWKALVPDKPEGVPRLKEVILESVLFILLAVGVEAWLVQRFGVACVVNAGTIIVATGILCDLVLEGRARATGAQLVAIWEIHQVYAVAPTIHLLEAQGWHPFARGLRLRSLLQFFGPYVPVQILVPAAEATTARTLLQARWPNSAGTVPGPEPLAGLLVKR
jgi:hypothetical protein